MPTRPPPSRYRVTERGRRLEVVDTWASARSRQASPVYADPAEEPDAGPIAGSSRSLTANIVTDAWSEAPRSALEPLDLPVASYAPADSAPSESPQPRAPEAMMAGPPELLRNVAATICGDARDGDGRLVFTTARFYDSRGPRRIALDLDGERELGLTMLVVLAVAVSGVVFAVLLGWPGIVLAFLAIALARQVKLVATPWLDRLQGRTG